jgi:SAM-dependent methyltransferase
LIGSMAAHVLTTDELRSKWDEFSSGFAAHIEKNLIPLAVSMVSVLRENAPTGAKFLEIGCGGGGAAQLYRHLLPSGSSLDCLDLSPDMVSLVSVVVCDFPQVVTDRDCENAQRRLGDHLSCWKCRTSSLW